MKPMLHPLHEILYFLHLKSTYQQTAIIGISEYELLPLEASTFKKQTQPNSLKELGSSLKPGSRGREDAWWPLFLRAGSAKVCKSYGLTPNNSLTTQ